MPVRSVLVAFSIVFAAHASAAERGPFVRFAGVASAPVGWKRLCREYPGECVEHHRPITFIPAEKSKWETLLEVNAWVNTRVAYKSDMEHWGIDDRWNFAEDGYGDCEDYVLLKRRMLIARGFKAETLLVALVMTRGEWHAVLVARSEKGDYVLDTATNEVRSWIESPYEFLLMQAPQDPSVWFVPEKFPHRIAAKK